MKEASDIFLILMSLIFSIVAKKKMFFENGAGKTLGLIFLILSFSLICYSTLSIFLNWNLSLFIRASIAVIILVVWLATRFIKKIVALKIKDQTLITISSLFFIFWIVSTDGLFTFSDCIILIGSAVLIGGLMNQNFSSLEKERGR